MLGGALCFFRDRESIRRNLDSLRALPLVICCDGRYTDYPYGSDFSDDGSRELVKEYANTVLMDCSATEMVKRTKILEATKEYNIDYLLWVDSDEYVLPDADWSLFTDNCMRVCNDSFLFYGVRFQYTTKPKPDWTLYPRLWYLPWNIEYHVCHNLYRDKRTGNVVKSGFSCQPIDGITLAGDDILRTVEHTVASVEYQIKLIAKESPLKRSLGF